MTDSFAGVSRRAVRQWWPVPDRRLRVLVRRASPLRRSPAAARPATRRVEPPLQCPVVESNRGDAPAVLRTAPAESPRCPQLMFRIGLNPYGLAYSIGLQGRG